MPERPHRPSYDVFVSYDPRDAAIVQELSRRVSADGFRVWLDTWELVPGAPATAAIERAVADSLVFAACVGQHTSTRLDGELDLAAHGSSGGRPSSVIVVLLPGGKVPSALADRPCVDMQRGVSREATGHLAQLILAARAASAVAATEGSDLTQIDYRRVLDHVAQVLVNDPSNIEAIRMRAFASLALGRQEDALAALERLAEIAPDDLFLITNRIPLLIRLQRSHEVPALVRSAEESVPRIVEQLAETFAGKSEEDITRDTDALSNVWELMDRYEARRLVGALRTDHERAVRILRAELVALEGQAFANANDLQGALAAWRRAIAWDPERTSYRLQLVGGLAATGQLDELDAQLEEWMGEGIPLIARLAQVWRALRTNHFDEALTHLEDAIAAAPHDPVPRAIRVDVLLALHRQEESAQDLRVLWENNPSNAQLFFRLMNLYRVLGKLDDEAALMDAWADNAEPLLRGLTRSPGGASDAGDSTWLRDLDRLVASGELADQYHACAATLRIQARWKSGGHDDVLRLTREGISRWPRQYVPWAIAIELLGQIEEWAALRVAALPDESAWIEPVWQAVVALVHGDAERASTRIEQVLNEVSDLGVVHWLHGHALEGAEALDAALGAFTRAIEIDRYAPAPLLSRAYVLRRLGRLEEALADLDVALDDLQAGMEQETYFMRGEIRRMLDRYRQAIEDFDRALTIPARTPGLSVTITGSRGQAKLGLGDVDGALQDLNAALEKNPDLVSALITRATAHLTRDDVDNAVADWRRVVELLPTDPDAWATYGMMLLETKQLETLWTALSQATSTHEALLQVTGIRSLLAQAAIGTGRFAEAEQHFHASVELDPDEDFWRYEEARAIRHQGRAEEARALVERALEQQVVPPPDAPTHLAVSSNRCLYLLAAGREREAEQEWRSLLRRVEDPELLRTQLEELDALEASGVRLPSIPGIRSSVQLRLEELTSALTE
jgi:tetratricopeptide (TPR) repeat protein